MLHYMYIMTHFTCSTLYFVLIFSSYKAQLEKLAVLEKEKRQLKDRANSLEAQLVLKGRAVKEVEGMIEQVEEKHKEVGITKGLLSHYTCIYVLLKLCFKLERLLRHVVLGTHVHVVHVPLPRAPQ